MTQLRRAAQRSGDAEFTTLTSAKIRPVLIIAETGDSFDGPAALALRLRRFSKLDPDEQRAVREGKAPRLFRLRPDRFPGLPEENAAAADGKIAPIPRKLRIFIRPRVARRAMTTNPVGASKGKSN